MNTEKLQMTGFTELDEAELKNTDGGWIFVAWGAMILMDAACIGLYYGYHNNK